MANSVDDLVMKTLNKVSETGDVSTGDLIVLKYCKKAKKTSSRSLTSVLSGAKEIVGFLQSTFGGE